MTDYTIRLGFEGPGFVAVPNVVAADRGISPDLLSALVFMALLSGGRSGQSVRVSAVRARFGWGEYAWRKVFGQMVDAGCLAFVYERSPDGRSVSRSLLVGWPGSMPEAERDAVRRAVARPSRKGLPVGLEKLPEGSVIEPVNEKTSFTQSSNVRTRKSRSRERENLVGVNEKISFPIQTHIQTAAEPDAPSRANPVSAAPSEPGNTRYARGVAPGEAAKVAENGQDKAQALACVVQRARLAAELGEIARCPVSGRWLPGSVWLSNDADGQYEVNRLLALSASARST